MPLRPALRNSGATVRPPAFRAPSVPARRRITPILSDCSSTGSPTSKMQLSRLYLCIVLGLVDRCVAGRSMHHRLDRKMVILAVQMAVWQRKGRHLIILHSDRGSQFRSSDYQSYLKANALVCSMSAAGHCGDSVAYESFFGILKGERIYQMSSSTRETAKADVFECIERLHNRRMRWRIAKRDLKFSTLSQPYVISEENPLLRGCWL